MSTTTTSETFVERCRSLPDDFGDGWLSRNARDLVRIAVGAGFPAEELVRRVAFAGNPRRYTNASTVERILVEMSTEKGKV